MTIVLSLMCFAMVYIYYRIETQMLLKVSPIISLGLAYCVLMVYVSILDATGASGTDKIPVSVPLVSILSITFFEFIGQIVLYVRFGGFVSRTLKENYKEKEKIEYKHQSALNIAMVIITTIILFAIFSGERFSIANLNNFKSNFSYGIIAHLINFESVLLLINYASTNNNIISKLFKWFVFIWLLFLTIANAKYSMLIFAVGILFTHILSGKKHIKFSTILIGLLIASSGFFLTYIIRFISQGYTITTVPYEFIFKHFNYYLTGGFYAFGKVLKGTALSDASVGFGIFLAPIINVWNALVGKPSISTISKFTNINMGSGYSSTNVYTLFGALILESGWLGLLMCLCIIAIIAYSLYVDYIYNYTNVGVAFYSYVCATLVFSFFNCFYGTLNIWEIMIFFGLFRLSEHFIIKIHR